MNMGTVANGKKPLVKKLKNFDHAGIVYREQDSVFIRGDIEDQPFIGKIKKIFEDFDEGDDIEDRLKLKVSWYYRPEEAYGGRKQFHGEREVFNSDHIDEVFACSIMGMCNVHTLSAYMALEQPGEKDFYSRFSYMVKTKEFKPDRVPVYCTCEMPFNPDKYMICCTSCDEWFHPACIGMTDAEVFELDSCFTCHACGCSAASSEVHKATCKTETTESTPGLSVQEGAEVKHSLGDDAHCLTESRESTPEVSFKRQKLELSSLSQVQ